MRMFCIPDQVDSWAVGVLTYELLVGSAPFDNESREEVCSGILDREPVYESWMSRGAKNFIKAALIKVRAGAASGPDFIILCRYSQLFLMF